MGLGSDGGPGEKVMPTMSILDAIAKMETQLLTIAEESHLAMERAAVLVERAAKAEIGHYQDGAGQFAGWRDLAPSTLVEKEQLGYSPPDNPLLREGDLRDSIEHTVHDWDYAVVGSNSDVALWQELGTHGPHPGADGYHVPPRSFLGIAGVRNAEKVAEILWSATERTLVSPGARMPIPDADAG